MTDAPAKFLVIQLNEEYFTIAAHDIKTIEKASYENGELRDVAKISGYPPFLEGLYIHQNHPIPLLSLSSFLTNQQLEANEENKIIVVNGRRFPFALLVEDVQDFVELKERDFTKPLPHYPMYTQFQDGRLYVMLDVENFIEKEQYPEIFSVLDSVKEEQKKND